MSKRSNQFAKIDHLVYELVVKLFLVKKMQIMYEYSADIDDFQIKVQMNGKH